MPIHQIGYSGFTNRPKRKLGFCATLTILFAALKLLGIIDWSWWWVVSPIWIPIVTVFTLILILVTIARDFAARHGIMKGEPFFQPRRNAGYDPRESSTTIIDQPTTVTHDEGIDRR